MVKKSEIGIFRFLCFWRLEKKIECLLRNWKMESFLKGYRWEEQKRKKENLDADCSGLCSFGANGSSAESAWILSLQGFALWLRPTRNGSESLAVQARNVKKNWSFLFFKWKWILLGNGSKFWKIKNWPQQNREKRSPGWNFFLGNYAPYIKTNPGKVPSLLT